MHIEESIHLPVPLETAWSVAQNPSLRPRWDRRITAYEVHDQPGPGARISITVRVGPWRPHHSGVLLRWVPPHQSVVKTESTSQLVPGGAGSWTFEPEGNGTRYTTRFTLQDADLHPFVPRWLYRLGVLLETRRSLRRLRRLVEELR